MADMKVKKKRLSLNLSFLALTELTLFTKPAKSHNKNFVDPNGLVGLGILAAMNDNDDNLHHHQDSIFINCNKSITSPKSSTSPIPIAGNENSAPFAGNSIHKKLSVEEMEMCEEYTCVISHVEGNVIKKREYFDADLLGTELVSGAGNGGIWVSCGVVSASSVSYDGQTGVFRSNDFLNSCFLCKKMLHGLDIFMYRGEKAFCSAECRCMQISIDEQNEKCSTGMGKPIDYSVSPCSGRMQFFAGVAAA